jgi:hypothetical protein
LFRPDIEPIYLDPNFQKGSDCLNHILDIGKRHIIPEIIEFNKHHQFVVLKLKELYSEDLSSQAKERIENDIELTKLVVNKVLAIKSEVVDQIYGKIVD